MLLKFHYQINNIIKLISLSLFLIQYVDSIYLKILGGFNNDPVPKSLPNYLMETFEKNIEKYSQLKEDPIEDKLETERKNVYNKFKASFVQAYSDRIEELSLIQIPEWKLILNERIIKYNKNDGNLIRKYGHGNVKNCNSTSIKLKQYERVSVCPSHYVLTVRKNKYPYMRVNVECNCQKCILFDKEQPEEKNFQFVCQQEFTLMPALEKVDFKYGQYNESRWVFSMEEVSTSCGCMRRTL
jgi:hypothetical protein